MCRQSATVCLTKSPSLRQRELPDVAERLATLFDPRDRRGRRHCLVTVQLTAACSELAGARSYQANGQWARNAPQEALARLRIRPRGPLVIRRAPATSTIRRELTLVCPGGLADLIGAAPAGADQVAVDGNSARGSRTDTDDAVHLLSALTGTGRVISQLPVPDKTTEVTAPPALLASFDLTGVTVTADALHTTREQACYLVEEKNAHFVLAVKRNQPRLHAVLRTLPWRECTAVRYDREQSHGRRETRSVRVLTVTGLAWTSRTSRGP
ncbi:ISAs1 family transposase [Streptomyces sp. NPDC052107]|uniref:ISAs1 family transposase n=1 Tax=Streptomyces sp. NPDC052107 TaxID=3155632 RepID=UPI00341B7A59